MITTILAAAAPAAADANPYGLQAALREGGLISQTVFGILVLMSVVSFYILFSKLFEQQKIIGQGKRVRQAFSMAVDRKAITEAIFNGTRQPAYSAISPVVDGSREDACTYCEYKPDEAKEAKQEETRPSETEEERAKRLRKEARRKLRVSWKPDDSLVEVRLFTHHPEEEIGPDDRLRRDAGDIKGEGRMLKLHKELEEEDEDEEMGIQEEALGEYRSPSGMFPIVGSLFECMLT